MRTKSDAALCAQMLEVHKGRLTDEALEVLNHQDTYLDVKVKRFSFCMLVNDTLGKSLRVAQSRMGNDDDVLVATHFGEVNAWRRATKVTA